MIAFALVATAMVGAALAWVLVPLLRRRDVADVDRDAANVDILRDQRRELEAELARGAITPEQHAVAKLELERRVLEEVATPSVGAGSAARRGSPWLVASVAGLFPIATLLLYLIVGAPQAFGPPAASPGAGQHVTLEQVEMLVGRLAERLEQQPDDPQGWTMLARANYALKRYEQAVKAYERATTLVPNDASLLADYADALATTLGGNLAGTPMELVRRALALDPNQWKALALAGTEAFERKAYAEAIGYWERVRAAAPEGSAVAQSIEASIAEARQLAAGGAKPSVGVAATTLAGAQLSGTVSLGAALRDKAAPEDAVFVFARAASGPRMPLAVQKTRVKDLPFRFALDDSMAMAPNLKLSDFAEVVVVARVSKSGNASAQSGDLEGTSAPVKAGTSDLAVVIDKTVP